MVPDLGFFPEFPGVPIFEVIAAPGDENDMLAL